MQILIQLFTGNPSDVDIELENNVGYDVSEQGQSVSIMQLYDYCSTICSALNFLYSCTVTKSVGLSILTTAQ